MAARIALANLVSECHRGRSMSVNGRRARPPVGLRGSLGRRDVILAPLFCSRQASNYGLQECSPAIGAGADSSDPIIGHIKPGDPLCPDTLAATASIRFLKNSIAPRFVDVYITVSERVADSTLVVTKTCENSASVPLEVVPADSTGTVFGFQGLETSNCGELQVAVSAVDLCDNGASTSRSSLP